MKTVFNIVLGLCALALIYICYTSIMGPINFEEAKKQRDQAVIARLIDIRKAQMEFRNLNKGQYTASFDTLIDFVKKLGLENFKRDTMWVAVLDTIYPKGFNPDSMRYIPFGGGAQFEMAIKNDTAKSGAPIFMFEVKAPYDTYLGGLDKQEIANLKDLQTKLGKYCGLMVGSIESPNNGAGNWE